MARAPIHRTGYRNTYIYSSTNRSSLLGGLWVGTGITNADLHSMVEIICVFSERFYLHNEREQLVARDEQLLQPGNYYIVTMGSIAITDEVPLTRTLFDRCGDRVVSFRDAVGQRDGRCVISQRHDPISLVSFAATPIFPFTHEKHWNDKGFGQWITIPPTEEHLRSIHSVQNGILLSLDLHFYFDSYEVTINPDDNYKIVCFSPGPAPYQIDGSHLDQAFLDNPLKPVDEVLRWHYRQAVLVNVKGLGATCLDHDCVDDSDECYSGMCDLDLTAATMSG